MVNVLQMDEAAKNRWGRFIGSLSDENAQMLLDAFETVAAQQTAGCEFTERDVLIEMYVAGGLTEADAEHLADQTLAEIDGGGGGPDIRRFLD